MGVGLGGAKEQGLHNPPPPPEREQGLDASQQVGAGVSLEEESSLGCAHSPPMGPFSTLAHVSEGCSLGRTSHTSLLPFGAFCPHLPGGQHRGPVSFLPEALRPL